MLSPIQKDYDLASITARKVLCIGLNPAFQTTLHFDSFRPRKVNRAFRKTHSIGGKGQNFVIACQQYGFCKDVSIVQFIGGMTGSYIEKVLEEKGIEMYNVVTRKPTRTCTTVVDFCTGDTTELIEPSSPISHVEKLYLDRIVSSLIHNTSSLKAIALCGTYPTGIDGSIYEIFASLKTRDDCWLLVDAYKDVERVLRTGKVNVLKINREEACLMCGLPSETTPTASAGKHIIREFNLDMVAITNGPDSAILVTSPTTYYNFILPSLHTISLLSHYPNTSASQSRSSSPLPTAYKENKGAWEGEGKRSGRKLMTEMSASDLRTRTSRALRVDCSATRKSGEINGLDKNFSCSDTNDATEKEGKPKISTEILTRLQKLEEINRSMHLPSPVTISRNEVSDGSRVSSDNENSSTSSRVECSQCVISICDGEKIMGAKDANGKGEETSPKRKCDMNNQLAERLNNTHLSSDYEIGPLTENGISTAEVKESLEKKWESMKSEKIAENDIVLNPLGAGDTCSGVFLMELAENRNPADAFRLGLAAASASCLVTESTAHFDKEVMQMIYEQIKVEMVVVDDE